MKFENMKFEAKRLEKTILQSEFSQAVFSGLMLTFLILVSMGCGKVAHVVPVDEQGLGFRSPSAAGTLSECEINQLATYQKTYFNFFQSQCTSCHIHSQGHASSDVVTSWSTFKNYGESLINYQATHPHGGNNFGAENEARIAQFSGEWSAAKVEFQKCQQEKSASSGTEISRDLKFVSKTIPDLEATRTNGAVWATVTWNLGDELERENLRKRLSGQLSVEVQYWRNNQGQPIGLAVRNPRLQLSATQDAVFLKGVRVYLNNSLRESITTFLKLNRTVASGQDLPLSGGTEVTSEPGISSSIRLGLELTAVSVGDEIVSNVDHGEGLPVTAPPPL